MRWYTSLYILLMMFNRPFIMAFSPSTQVRVQSQRHMVIPVATMSRQNHTKDNIHSRHIIKDCINKGIRNHRKACGILILKSVSALLPYVDTIGHKVLHANNEFINYVLSLNEKYVPHKIKGKIILLMVRMAQSGDNFGGKMLQWYHDIVKSCFEQEEDDS